MSGKFVNGRWVTEPDVETVENPEFFEEINTLLNEVKRLRHINARLIELEQKVQTAGVKTRLWYLLSGRL